MATTVHEALCQIHSVPVLFARDVSPSTSVLSSEARKAVRPEIQVSQCREFMQLDYPPILPKPLIPSLQTGECSDSDTILFRFGIVG
jgi:hypothetical protein